VGGGSPAVVFSVFWTEDAAVSCGWLVSSASGVGCAPFRIRCFSEGLEAPRTVHGPLGLWPGALAPGPRRRGAFFYVACVDSIRALVILCSVCGSCDHWTTVAGPCATSVTDTAIGSLLRRNPCDRLLLE
jgi:hypothetical protein